MITCGRGLHANLITELDAVDTSRSAYDRSAIVAWTSVWGKLLFVYIDDVTCDAMAMFFACQLQGPVLQKWESNQ